MHACLYGYECEHVLVFFCMYMCMTVYASAYVYVYMLMYICMHVCMYMCICKWFHFSQNYAFLFFFNFLNEKF